MSSTSTSGSSKTAREQSIDAAKDIAFGSVAGIVAKIVEYPFDTIKVRLQSQAHDRPLQYTGPLDCFRQSLSQNGISGLYRGVSAPLLGAAAEVSSLFMSYRVAQNVFKATLYPDTETLPLSVLVACGAISGAFSSFVLNPIELVKCRMQVPANVNGRQTQPSARSLIASIYKHNGIFGFWRGHTGTFLREVGGTAAYFGAYESVSAAFRQNATAPRLNNAAFGLAETDIERTIPVTLPVYQQMIAGAAAGMSYNFLFYPADTIKSTVQTRHVGPGACSSTSFWSEGKAIWQRQGIRGLYRGCGLTVCRSAPSSALIFSIYEALKTAF